MGPRARGARLQSVDVVVPAAVIRVGGAVEAALERCARSVDRLAAVGAKAEGERHLVAPLAVQVGASGLYDVAARRQLVAAVHAVVGGEVRPAVARAEKAARGAPEARVGKQRAGRGGVPGDEAAGARGARVVIAVVRERGVVQHVQLERTTRERAELDVHEHAAPRRVGRIGLDDPVEPVAVAVDVPVREALRVEQAHALLGRVLLALREGAAVRHDELEVAQRGRAEIGVVDLGQAPVVDRQPGLAAQAGGGAKAVLVRLGPDRLLPWCPGRRAVHRGGGGGENEH